MLEYKDNLIQKLHFSIPNSCFRFKVLNCTSLHKIIFSLQTTDRVRNGDFQNNLRIYYRGSWECFGYSLVKQHNNLRRCLNTGSSPNGVDDWYRFYSESFQKDPFPTLTTDFNRLTLKLIEPVPVTSNALKTW